MKQTNVVSELTAFTIGNITYSDFQKVDIQTRLKGDDSQLANSMKQVERSVSKVISFNKHERLKQYIDYNEHINEVRCNEQERKQARIAQQRKERKQARIEEREAQRHQLRLKIINNII